MAVSFINPGISPQLYNPVGLPPYYGQVPYSPVIDPTLSQSHYGLAHPPVSSDNSNDINSFLPIMMLLMKKKQEQSQPPCDPVCQYPTLPPSAPPEPDTSPLDPFSTPGGTDIAKRVIALADQRGAKPGNGKASLQEIQAVLHELTGDERRVAEWLVKVAGVKGSPEYKKVYGTNDVTHASDIDKAVNGGGH